MLLQLHEMSNAFCQQGLKELYGPLNETLFDNSVEQLPAAVGGNTLREIAIETRKKAHNQQLAATYLSALRANYSDFDTLLQQRDNGRPLTVAAEHELEPLIAKNTLETIESNCSLQLGQLNQRLSVLVGMKITAKRNPFSPSNYIDAFETSVANLHWNHEVRAETVELFATHCLNELPSLYAAMNERLIDNGILPSLVAANEENHSSTATAEIASSASGNVRTVTDLHTPGLQSAVVEATEIRLLAANEDDSLLPDEAADQTDAQDACTLALESVGKLINQLLSYDQASTHIKTLLSSLYIPYARIAMSDPTFAANSNHPGHCLLRSIERTVELYQTEAPTLQRPALLLILDELINKITSLDLGTHTLYELAFEFNAKLRQQERLIDGRSQKKKLGRYGINQIDGLRLSLRKKVQGKIDLAEQIPPAKIERFLLGLWTNYVAGLYLKPDSDSEVAEYNLTMVDRVISYSAGIQRKSAAEFAEITAAIRKGMMVCGAEEYEVHEFINELKHFHAHPRPDVVIGSHKTPQQEAELV